MATVRVVEAFDITEHVRLGLCPRSVDLLAHPLGLEGREEAFHSGVIPDVAGPAHRTGDPVVGHEPLELLAGILAALVRVMQQGIGFPAPPDRHDERVGDELCRHRATHRPAHHPGSC